MINFEMMYVLLWMFGSAVLGYVAGKTNQGIIPFFIETTLLQLIFLAGWFAL